MRVCATLLRSTYHLCVCLLCSGGDTDPVEITSVYVPLSPSLCSSIPFWFFSVPFCWLVQIVTCKFIFFSSLSAIWVASTRVHMCPFSTNAVWSPFWLSNVILNQ
ncbi:hypothetical protein XENORESO_012261 [Xenotaenia resolanae]|uniref:Secreted protein n=1 Tax=Xenotaenia resolanae TaxID=208358 RepID=A0ABV0WGZ4_9TELE